MQEIAQINSRLKYLADRLMNYKDILDDEGFHHGIVSKTQEMRAEFDHLNRVLGWWSSQRTYILSHAKGSQSAGFRVTRDPVDPRIPEKVEAWESPESLLRRLDARGCWTLEAILQEWVAELTRRGMLSTEDAAQVMLVMPKCERLERLREEERQERREFDAGFAAILAKVEAHAESQDKRPGSAHRAALWVWNRRDRRKDREELGRFVRELASEKPALLPKEYAMMRGAQDALKKLLGV